MKGTAQKVEWQCCKYSACGTFTYHELLTRRLVVVRKYLYFFN